MPKPQPPPPPHSATQLRRSSICPNLFSNCNLPVFFSARFPPICLFELNANVHLLKVLLLNSKFLPKLTGTSAAKQPFSGRHFHSSSSSSSSHPSSQISIFARQLQVPSPPTKGVRLELTVPAGQPKAKGTAAIPRPCHPRRPPDFVGVVPRPSPHISADFYGHKAFLKNKNMQKWHHSVHGRKRKEKVLKNLTRCFGPRRIFEASPWKPEIFRRFQRAEEDKANNWTLTK